MRKTFLILLILILFVTAAPLFTACSATILNTGKYYRLVEGVRQEDFVEIMPNRRWAYSVWGKSGYYNMMGGVVTFKDIDIEEVATATIEQNILTVTHNEETILFEYDPTTVNDYAPTATPVPTAAPSVEVDKYDLPQIAFAAYDEGIKYSTNTITIKDDYSWEYSNNGQKKSGQYLLQNNGTVLFSTTSGNTFATGFYSREALVLTVDEQLMLYIPDTLEGGTSPALSRFALYSAEGVMGADWIRLESVQGGGFELEYRYNSSAIGTGNFTVTAAAAGNADKVTFNLAEEVFADAYFYNCGILTGDLNSDCTAEIYIIDNN